MSRPKGLPKTGGRICGTPNKKTDELARKLAKLGCDPIEGLARIALDPESKPELRVRCLAELAQYLYPKRKAVDPLIKVENTVPKREVDYGDLPRQIDALQGEVKPN
jgi:hypothetical protein